MNKNKLCVFVIVGFNNPSVTEKLIVSFKENIKKIELVLFDNSNNPDLLLLAKKYHLVYLPAEKNLGFSAGCNWIVEWVLEERPQAKVVGLLNNDLVFPNVFGERFRDSLEEFLSEKNMVALSPIFYKDSKLTKLENAGVLYFQSGLAFQNRRTQNPHNCLLNAACLFLKMDFCKKTIKKDGFIFQPSFFLNGEDVELSLRILSRGFRFKIDPSLKIQHLGSLSIKKMGEEGILLSWRNLIWTTLMVRKISLIDLVMIIFGQLLLLILSFKYQYFLIIPKIYLQTIRDYKKINISREKFMSKSTVPFTEYVHFGVAPLPNFKR
jgi:GT2 family glycosyltransferase